MSAERTTSVREPDAAELFSSALLIEDEAGHAKLISRALRNIIGELTHVSSGADALKALSSSLPELVLCDLFLPDMSGLQLLGTIRELRPGLPVVVMTSSSKLDDAVSAMREGAWDYMVKEFSDEFDSRVQLVVRGVAERKLQEMRELQLRAERDAFSQAVRSATDGLAVVGSDGRVIFSNEAFSKFIEVATAGVVGEDAVNITEVVQLHDAAVAEQLRAQLDTDRDGGESLLHSEIKLKNPPTTVENAYYELILTSIRLGGAYKQAPEGYEGLRLHRHVVWVRNISEKKAQERFQRDILSTTSHDLKGPLGAIVTSAELLSQFVEEGNKRAQDLITRVGSCARNCISLIDELLSARRIQDGVMVIKPHHYDVAEIMEDIVLDYLPMAKAKSITLSYKPLPEVTMIYADRMGLQRVLGNLVSNAIKFTPQNGLVELSAAKTSGYVVISVMDNGPGIESEARHKLFQRYARLDQHQEVEGSGLGLFVTKSIVDAHDGRIEISSEVGKGTIFKVFFPDCAQD